MRLYAAQSCACYGVRAIAANRQMEYRRAAMDAIAQGTLPRLEAATLDIAADPTHRERQVLAFQDVSRGARLWRLGLTLGWLDIKLKYRGSLLGPFWLTISTGVMVAAMGGLYGKLFHMDLRTYLPFLALSLVMWNAISGLVSDACTTFTQSESTIRSVRMPFFLHAVRVVTRSVISFLHNVPVILAVFAIFSIWPGYGVAFCVPGLALWMVDAFAACLLLGSFCARFRDIPPIVASIMQIMFFVTPVVWRPEQLGPKGWLLPFNPFDAILEVVRGPLLGHTPGHLVWALAFGYSAAFCAVSWLLFARVRERLAYWM
jgi:lipopolysaccharide transport system permease protein